MKTISAVIAAAVILGSVALSGCAGDPAQQPTGPTLLDVKRSVQLERNGIAGQISPSITEAITEVNDASYACGSDELMRSWRSTALTELTAETASRVASISQSLVGSYVAVGWQSSAKQLDNGDTEVTLTKEGTLARFVVTTTEDADGDGRGATIRVDVTGPCVLTDGPGSDELTSLGE